MELSKVPTRGAVGTFKQLAEWYKTTYVVPPVYHAGKKVSGLRTWKDQTTAVDRLVDYLGHLTLDEITPDLLLRRKASRLRSVSVTSVNREFKLLKSMLTKAFDRRWMLQNPFTIEKNLIQVALENKRQSTVDRQLIDSLLEKATGNLKTLIIVLANTGARPSEIFPYEKSRLDGAPQEPLNWERILQHDFKAVTLVSYKGKVRLERIVPTSEDLEVALRVLYAEKNPAPADLVFNQTTFKRSWKTLCKNAGVKDVRMRDFRHYFNSYLVSRPDINDMERMLIMGHTGLSTNIRYSKLDTSIVEKFRNGKRIDTDS